MFSMAQNSYMTSIFNNPKLLHHKNLGPITHLILKFEACILLLSYPSGNFKLYFYIRFYINLNV